MESVSRESPSYQLPYEPHEKQMPFHISEVKFKAAITGVGFGKSAMGSNELLFNALKYPKAMHLILAPTSKIMHYATLAQFWKFCPKQFVKAHIKSQNIIYLVNGARIIYLTADNERHIDRLRGIEIGSFWVDEARLMPSYVWEILLTRLRDKKGALKGCVTTTPHGFDWLYWYFIKKRHPRTKEELSNSKDYEVFTGSSLDNPFTPEEYKETLVNQFSGKFSRQEIYGEFVGFEGQVYDNFRHKLHMINEENVPKKMKEYICAIDWGFTNPMVGLIIGFDNDDRAYVLEEYYRKRQEPKSLGNWLLKQREKYPFTIGYPDPSEPMMIQQLQNMGLNLVKASNSIMPGINFVYSMFEVAKDGKPRLYVHEKCENLIDEINVYKYANPKEGKMQKEEPEKSNDHACDALRYGLYTHKGERGNFTVLDSSGGMF